METLESVIAERDRLHDHLQKMQVTNGSLTDEVDRLKAELETEITLRKRFADDFISTKEDRDLWKSKAEKLAETLKILSKGNRSPGVLKIAKEALAEYEKGV